MYLKKETLEQIKRKYSVLIVSDDDVVDAFNLVNDIMTAEADAIKEGSRPPRPLSAAWSLPPMRCSASAEILKTKIFLRVSKFSPGFGGRYNRR